MEHTERLEAAMVAVTRKAYDARGLLVHLCNPLDVADVRRRMHDMARSLQPGAQHIRWDGESITQDRHAESNTARNLALLAELLSAHLEYEHERREPYNACSPPTY